MADRMCSANLILLTTRQRGILVELLLADQVVAVAEIASRLEITPRRVRYDLMTIRSWLEARGIRLLKRPHYGILVGASAQARMDLHHELTELAPHRLVLSPTERLHTLLLSLLTGNEPVLAKQLRSQLGVSYPTVLADMGRAKEWLARRGHELVGRPHVGFLAVGTERGRREALIELLLETVGNDLMALCGKPGPTLRARMKGDGGPEHGAREFAASLELDLARDLVEAVEGLLSQQYADTARISLLLCLAIVMQRAQQGKQVQLEPECLEILRSRQEFGAARIAADQIAQRTGIVLAEPEVGYIAMQLLGAGVRKPLSTAVAAQEAPGVDAEVREAVRSFVASASIYLQPCLMVDEQLRCNLEFHLQRIMNRLRFGLPIRNPLLADIKSQYPYIFQVTARASAALESNVGKKLPEEETGYLAMHLGAAMERFRGPLQARRRVLVVCGEGVATAWLLVSRIQAEFPAVEVVGVIPAVEASEEYAVATHVAAIISTVPMTTQSVPVVIVSPLLPAQDVSNLRATLQVATTGPPPATRSREAPGAALSDLLHAETLALQVAADNWVDVVDAAGALLLGTGAIEPEYVAAMKSLIEQHGPYVVIMPEVALLHAQPGKGVHHMAMSLVTLSKPVPFGHVDHDPVTVAVAVATIDDHAHWRALKQLVELLADHDSLHRIKNATSKEQVLHLIAMAPRQERRQ